MTFDPRKRFQWKQDTPRQQLIVIRQAIWGTLDNMVDGAGDAMDNAKKVNDLSQELLYLTSFYLEKGKTDSW